MRREAHIQFFPFCFRAALHEDTPRKKFLPSLRERPANPIPPARAFGIMFADYAWLIERKARMTAGSGELGYSVCLPALAGNRGRVILGRKSSFH